MHKFLHGRNACGLGLLFFHTHRDKEMHMGTDSSTNFPPAGEPKEDPTKTLGKSMEELTDEADKHLSEKEKKSGGSIKHAPPGRSDIIP
jgi:hypothetical protein